MKELKFRAWDKRTRKMIFTGFYILGEVTCFDLLRDYCMKHGFRKGECSLLRMNSLIIMQYTGLKDKNGKDIYEGDIVTDGISKAVIYYRPPGFVCIDKEQESWWLGSGLSYPDNSQLKVTKIIGDIYSNPELLKGGS